MEKERELPAGLSRAGTSRYGYLRDDEYVLLECKEDGADKFWGAFPDGGSWVVFWGRNGRRPQQSQRVDRREAQRRLDEKLRGGYEPSKTAHRLQDAFLTAPEWFGNFRDLSAQFTSLMEKAALTLRIQAEELTPKEAKERQERRRKFQL